jgi:tetratricopeptide (TPR) repeat protein
MRLVALALGVALFAGPLRAQTAASLYAEGQAEYNLGHFREALGKYEGAYKLKAVPALLFNIAQCHRQLGDMKSAASAYRAYLRNTNKTDPHRAKAESLLAEVEAAMKRQVRAQEAPPLGPAKVAGEEARAENKPAAPPPVVEAPKPTAPVAEPPKTVAVAEPAKPVVALRPVPAPHAATSAPAPLPREPERTRVFTWIAAGGAVVALGAGAMFGLKAKSTKSDLESSPHDQAYIDQHMPDVSSNAGKANALFVAGVVLAAAAGTFYVLRF